MPDAKHSPTPCSSSETAKNRWFAPLLALLLASQLGACASTGGGRASDPFERFNRAMYAFNRDMDSIVLKPVAEVYDTVLPVEMNEAITNFFSNLDDLVVMVNNLLQLKGEEAASDLGRVLLNTIVGFFGFADVATPHGLEKHYEDFGQTLGYWGIGSGPYLVLPLFGPSSLRDGVGLLVDKSFDPRMTRVDEVSSRNALYSATLLNIVDVRADMLGAEQMLDTAAVDGYSFLRDAYLQRREAFVRDGRLPDEPKISDDELFDD
jgi:phospholipid-binding lipoprotein MlaA